MSSIIETHNYFERCGGVLFSVIDPMSQAIEYFNVRAGLWLVGDTRYSDQYLGSGRTKRAALLSMKKTVVKHKLQMKGEHA